MFYTQFSVSYYLPVAARPLNRATCLERRVSPPDGASGSGESVKDTVIILLDIAVLVLEGGPELDQGPKVAQPEESAPAKYGPVICGQPLEAEIGLAEHLGEGGQGQAVPGIAASLLPRVLLEDGLQGGVQLQFLYDVESGVAGDQSGPLGHHAEVDGPEAGQTRQQSLHYSIYLDVTRRCWAGKPGRG